MSKQMIDVFNTFSNYYNEFVDYTRTISKYHSIDLTIVDELCDYVKRVCNIEELEVRVNDGEYIYRCDADEITQRKSEWNLEQHTVWHAWNCALATGDNSDALEAVQMYEYAIRSLLALAV